MAELSALEQAIAQFDAALQSGGAKASFGAGSPCQLWKTVRPAVVDLIAALEAVGMILPWAAEAARVLKTLQTLLDVLCSASAAAPSSTGNTAVDDALRRFDAALKSGGVHSAALPGGFATPCEAWKALRPSVLSIIAALNAVGALVPVAKRAAQVLQTLANMLDALCGSSPPPSGHGPSGAAASGSPSPGPATSASPTTPPCRVHRFGWVPDLPDARDHLYAAPVVHLGNLPGSVDLRPQCPSEIYDQGQLGSCTANAIGAAIEFDQMKQGLSAFTPSRLFIYYNERVMMGDNYVNEDSGAQIRDGVKSVATQGVPPETMWPYDINQFTVKPPDDVYQAALQQRVKSYQRLVQNVNQMKGCLASGFPFVFGFTVYDSFESNEASATGNIPMPNTAAESVLGGHAVLAVGYDDAQQRFIFRNSWGKDWGNSGYGTMPYAYLIDTNLSDDFWTIRLV